jgi:hypothetical protein
VPEQSVGLQPRDLQARRQAPFELLGLGLERRVHGAPGGGAGRRGARATWRGQSASQTALGSRRAEGRLRPGLPSREEFVRAATQTTCACSLWQSNGSLTNDRFRRHDSAPIRQRRAQCRRFYPSPFPSPSPLDGPRGAGGPPGISCRILLRGRKSRPPGYPEDPRRAPRRVRLDRGFSQRHAARAWSLPCLKNEKVGNSRFVAAVTKVVVVL